MSEDNQSPKRRRRRRRSSSVEPETRLLQVASGAVNDIVQRQHKNSVQEQYRKTDKLDEQLFGEFMRLLVRADDKIPPYSSDTRERDRALLAFVRSENLLSGVFNSVLERDKNRGWSLTGIARQVSRYATRLNRLNNGEGWRQFVSMLGMGYYSTNLGAVGEIGYESARKPSRTETMWAVDPTNCRLQNNAKYPLIYYPHRGGKIFWERDDFIHSNSMPSVEEGMNRAGFCAVERCLTFARILFSVHQHQLEKLGAVLPKGILHGRGIQREEWKNAIAQYREDRKTQGNTTYDGVMLLFTQLTEAELKLISLSDLPDNFEYESFVETLMKGLSLAFAYPVGEVWAVRSGSFGRAGELEVQNERASTKGELAFINSLREQISTYFLPSGLLLEFDQRDDQGDLQRANVEQVITSTAANLYNTKDDPNNRILTRDEIRSFLAIHGVIPSDWTNYSEDARESNVTTLRDQLLMDIDIRRAASFEPDEPIVRFDSRTGRTNILFLSGYDLLQRKIHPVSIPATNVIPLTRPDNNKEVKNQ